LRRLRIVLVVAPALTTLLTTKALAQYAYQTDLVPIAQEYGVGYVQYLRGGDLGGTWESWAKFDSDSTAIYGITSGGCCLSVYSAWAIFDVSAFQSPIDVKNVWITSYIYHDDADWNPTSYHGLSVDPRTSDAETIWNAMPGGDFYADDLLGLPPFSEGEYTTLLNATARTAFFNAVNGSGLFGVWIYNEDGPVTKMKGWSQGMPRLTVAYEYPTPTFRSTWGAVKALYR